MPDDDDDDSNTSWSCFPGLLTIILVATLVLVILKLTGVLEWGWVAVLSPLLAYIAISIGSMVCLVLCGALVLIVAILAIALILIVWLIMRD